MHKGIFQEPKVFLSSAFEVASSYHSCKVEGTFVIVHYIAKNKTIRVEA
jgi:hypothetical protein